MTPQSLVQNDRAIVFQQYSYQSFMNDRATYLIEKLKLKPHPEGGYFSEIFRSDEIIVEQSLPKRYDGNRNFYTSIYFLLNGNQCSKFHRLKSDEIWHFYEGCPLIIYQINQNGELIESRLGNNPENGEYHQFQLKNNYWFGAKLSDIESYAFIGCCVAPGFEYQDFELADRNNLQKQYPNLTDVINKLT